MRVFLTWSRFLHVCVILPIVALPPTIPVILRWLFVFICFRAFHLIYSPPAYLALTARSCDVSKEGHMRTKLTPAFVQKARAEDGRQCTLFWDTDMPGFGLAVSASGRRSFVVQYRANGRSRRMTIDGVLGLAAARKHARALLGEVAKDRDPLQERRNRISLAEDTFKSIAEAYFAREGKKLRSIAIRQRVLERLVYPRIGAQPISAIRRSDIVWLLDRIEDENGPVQADRTLAYVGRIMNWQASRSDEFRSPIV